MRACPESVVQEEVYPSLKCQQTLAAVILGRPIPFTINKPNDMSTPVRLNMGLL